MQAIAYQEPSILQILSLGSLLALLNAGRAAFDRLCGVGLIWEIALGCVWGEPIGGWLSPGLQEAIIQIGYVGLLVLVFEGKLRL